jgi:hypothetical protein
MTHSLSPLRGWSNWGRARIEARPWRSCSVRYVSVAETPTVRRQRRRRR